MRFRREEAWFSAAAIVAGLVCEQVNTPAPAKITQMANAIEGHPDNVAACLLGAILQLLGLKMASKLGFDECSSEFLCLVFHRLNWILIKRGQFQNLFLMLMWLLMPADRAANCRHDQILISYLEANRINHFAQACQSMELVAQLRG
jgi:hypothetical protein